MTVYTVSHLIRGFGHKLTMERHLKRGNGGCKNKKKTQSEGRLGGEGR